MPAAWARPVAQVRRWGWGAMPCSCPEGPIRARGSRKTLVLLRGPDENASGTAYAQDGRRASPSARLVRPLAGLPPALRPRRYGRGPPPRRSVRPRLPESPPVDRGAESGALGMYRTRTYPRGYMIPQLGRPRGDCSHGRRPRGLELWALGRQVKPQTRPKICLALRCAPIALSDDRPWRARTHLRTPSDLAEARARHEAVLADKRATMPSMATVGQRAPERGSGYP